MFGQIYLKIPLTGVDFFIITILLIFFWAGWLKGFLRSVIGPLSLLLSLGISAIYYIFTHKFFYAVLISLSGPVILSILFSIILKVWNKKVDDKKSLHIASRICGALLSLTWYGGIFILSLILLAMIPLHIPGMYKIQNLIKSSQAYTLSNRWFGPQTQMFDIQTMIITLKNPATQAQIQSSAAYQILTNDYNFQNLLSDEQLLKELEGQNTFHLLSNEKVQAILNNKDSLEKFMAVQTEIIKHSFEFENLEEKPVEVERGI